MTTPPISIIEVGPRDGLQNAPEILSLDQKKNFIQALLGKGFMNIEAGAFVREDKVPAMAGSSQMAQDFKDESHKLWYLAPNQKGLTQALESGARQLAFFTASSDDFNTKNIGMTREKSVEVITHCVNEIKNQGYEIVSDWTQTLDPKNNKQVKLRLYISTVIGCPYLGKMKPELTVELIEKLYDLNFAQISLGDTIGVGVPRDWKNLFQLIPSEWNKNQGLALHCHDTYGTALACVAEGLNQDVRSFDSSIGGLGGCPFAPGASGNLATEDLVYFLNQEGLDCGLKISDLRDIFTSSRTGQLKNISHQAQTCSTSNQ